MERTKIKKLEITKKRKEVKKSASLFLDKNKAKIKDVKIDIPKTVINPRSFPLSTVAATNIQDQISSSEQKINTKFCFGLKYLISVLNFIIWFFNLYRVSHCYHQLLAAAVIKTNLLHNSTGHPYF